MYVFNLRVFAVVSTGRNSIPFPSEIFADEGKLLRAILKVKSSTPNDVICVELNRIDGGIVAKWPVLSTILPVAILTPCDSFKRILMKKKRCAREQKSRS